MNNKEFGTLLMKDFQNLFGGILSEDCGYDGQLRLVSHVDLWGKNSWLIEYDYDDYALRVATRKYRGTEVKSTSIDLNNPNYLEIITEQVNKHKTFEEE